MRIAIVGSREFPDLKQVQDWIALLNDEFDAANIRHQLVIITGYNERTKQPRGVDRVVAETARALNIRLVTFPADWERYGGRRKNPAGIIRNETIVKEADKVVVFWDGKSHGSRNVIDKCRIFNTDYEVHFPDSTKGTGNEGRSARE